MDNCQETESCQLDIEEMDLMLRTKVFTRVSSMYCTGYIISLSLQEKDERIAVLETENAILHLQIAQVRGRDISHIKSTSILCNELYLCLPS